MEANNNLIFVSVASYRDPELVPTLRDLFQKAKYPQNLRIGLCWQHDDTESLEEFADHPQVKVYECDWIDSKGTCWARHMIQKLLFNYEQYYFQLDSHHRFLEYWDEHLISLYQEARQHCAKPIIGGYGTTYWPKEDRLVNDPYQICLFDTFESDGDIISKPILIHNHENIRQDGTNLIPARLLSGHFIFTAGTFCRDCIYDPHLYFRGEEITLSVRAYTHGYDFFHPAYSIVWHYYMREENKKHWTDNDMAGPSEVRSKTRQRILLGMSDDQLNFRCYGLGNVRSLHDYELYCGVDFKNRRVHQNAVRLNDNPDLPFAYVLSEKEWDEGMLVQRRYDISWRLNDIPDNVIFENWFFGFETQDNELIWRKDFKNENEYWNKIFTKKTNSHTAVFSTETNKIPYKCVIIPFSKTEGYHKRIDIILPETTHKP